MRLEMNWSVSGESEKPKDPQSLQGLVGKWPISVDVEVTTPFEYSQGPVRKESSIGEVTNPAHAHLEE